MSDTKAFEVDLVVRAHGQDDYRISREYMTDTKASTDGAAREIWDAIPDAIRAKMRPVGDDR